MSFATIDELRTFVNDATLDMARAQQALNFATGKIQGYTRQEFSETADSTITIRGTWGDTFYLPQRPVTDVDSITVDGILAAALSYEWSSDGKVTLAQDPSFVINLAERDGGYFGGDRVLIRIVYSYGLAPIPNDVKAVCCALAARSLATPAGGATQSVTLGSFTEQFFASQGHDLTDDEKSALKPYRRSAGSIAARS